jgi:hypothetical protein
MNGIEIMQTIVKDNAACKFFGGLMSIDRLQAMSNRRNVFYICNTDKWVNAGKHWVLIYFINGSAEFFDPLGNPPDKLFVTFMKKHVRKVTFNKRRVQPLNSNVCGEFCIFFASMRSRGVTLTDVLLHMKYYKRVLDYVEYLKKSF